MGKAFSYTLPTSLTTGNRHMPQASPQNTSIASHSGGWAKGLQEAKQGLTKNLGERGSLLMKYKYHLSVKLLEAAAT